MTNFAPQLLPTFARLRRTRFWPLFSLIPLGIVAGVLSGALMNAFNGAIGCNNGLSSFWKDTDSHFFDLLSVDVSTERGCWLSALLSGVEVGFWFGCFYAIILRLRSTRFLVFHVRDKSVAVG